METKGVKVKKAEFNLDFPSVEEMPIHHSSKELSREQIKEVCNYRRNDVLATFELLKIVLGDTEHPIYKENNQVELRFSIKEEFGIECLNYSDIKIGDELLKMAYCKQKNIHIKELPKKGTFRKGIDMKKCIPKYVEFQTPLLQNLLKELKSTFLKRNDKWEKKFTIGNTNYVQGIGGLHSVNEGKIYKATDTVKIKTIDVSSMYPASIVNNGYYPWHLGKELLVVYQQLYEKRISLKSLSKNNKKIKGIVDALKLVLNACFGKMGSMESWLYDFQALCSITLTGQFSLLMLIEELELKGFSVIIANTDGIEVFVPLEKEEEFKEICKKWEEKTKYVLEEDEYKSIFMSTVNDYIAFTTSEKMKTKGDLISDFEIHKNKSWRVVPLALQAYFKEGKNPKEFIENHTNIFDFCIMAKANGQLHLEEIFKDGTFKEHKKLIRYYLSSDSDSQLFKRGIGSTGKEMNVNLNAPNDLGEVNIQYFNQFEDKMDYKIDKRQYIYKALKIIDKIEGTKKAKKYVEQVKNINQMSLF